MNQMQISSFCVKFPTDYLLCVRTKIVLYLNLSQYGEDSVLPNFARIFALTNNCKISVTCSDKDLFPIHVMSHLWISCSSPIPIFSFWDPGYKEQFLSGHVLVIAEGGKNGRNTLWFSKLLLGHT